MSAWILSNVAQLRVVPVSSSPRNNATAEGLGFRGTPSFIVGKFRVPGVLTMDQFEQVIADARKAKAGH